MKDIAPEMIDNIKNSFNQRYRINENIKKLVDELGSKSVNHTHSHDFSIEVGKMLVESFKEHITSDILPDGKMYYNIATRVLNETLGNNHKLVSEYSVDVQNILNKNAGINIKAAAPELNQSRIDGMIERLSESDDFDKIKWMLDEPVKNFTQSVVDDTVKKNIEFHSALGIKATLVRKTSGNCCDWCNKLAGEYNYPDVPKDVYKRHSDCNCEVLYYPGKGNKVRNAHTKKWTSIKNDDKIEVRKGKNENPRILHKKSIDTKNFKKGSGKNYPIKFVSSIGYVKFDSDKVTKVTVMAGNGVKAKIRDAKRLEEFYGEPASRWEKTAGTTYIRHKKERLKVEIHWYEANGKRHEIKVKKVLDDEG